MPRPDCKMRGVFVLLAAAAALASTVSCAPLTANDANTVVVAVGSAVTGQDYVTYVDVITPSSNSHKNGTAPPSLLNVFGSAAAQNGSIFFVGGTEHGSDSQNSFLSYNVRADQWTTLPPFPFGIQQSAVAVVNTQLLSMGGLPKTGQINDVYAFDLSAQSNQTWVKLPTQLPTTSFPVCAVVNNKTQTVYLLVESGDLYRSSDGAQSWAKLKSLANGGRQAAACAALEDVIVVAGGNNVANGSLDSASVYDIAKDEWNNTMPLSKHRDSAQAVAVPTAEGKSQVVVCGGFDNDGNLFNDCEQLDLAANKWSPAGFNLTVQLSFFGLFAASLD